MIFLKAPSSDDLRSYLLPKPADNSFLAYLPSFWHRRLMREAPTLAQLVEIRVASCRFQNWE